MKFLSRKNEIEEEKRFYYLLDLEKQYKSSQKRLSDKELVEIFGPSKEMLLEKIKEWEKIGKIKENKIIEKLKIINSYKIKNRLSNFEIWVYQRIIFHFFLPELLNCIEHILRLKRLLFFTLPKHQRTYRDNFQEKIENARNKPILEIAGNYLSLKQIGDKHVTLCPFHNEKTASFYLYPQTNSFYCFGCKKSGDVIDLVRQLTGLDFKQAINYLN
ncbi:MAG: hypothetical protein GF335_04850 [Candidatus Moranbacteria bacterium]|nr:hypothetical protein [Candidatus Moranbacteria bacterium]